MGLRPLLSSRRGPSLDARPAGGSTLVHMSEGDIKEVALVTEEGREGPRGRDQSARPTGEDGGPDSADVVQETTRLTLLLLPSSEDWSTRGRGDPGGGGYYSGGGSCPRSDS